MELGRAVNAEGAFRAAVLVGRMAAMVGVAALLVEVVALAVMRGDLSGESEEEVPLGH